MLVPPAPPSRRTAEYPFEPTEQDKGLSGFMNSSATASRPFPESLRKTRSVHGRLGRAGPSL